MRADDQVERPRARSADGRPRRCARPSPWPPPKSPARRTSSCRPTSWPRRPSAGRCLQRTPPPVSEPDDEALRAAGASHPEGARGRCCSSATAWCARAPSPALRELCRRTGLHVITTFMGKGVLDAGDEHFLFTAGLHAQDYPAGFLGRADLVVCVGYDMVEWAPSAWNPDGRPAHHLHRHGAARDRRPLRARGRARRRPQPHPRSSSAACWPRAAAGARGAALPSRASRRRSTSAPTTTRRSSRSACCATCARSWPPTTSW